MLPLLLALWLGPQDKPPEKCSLSGTVVDAESNQPLQKVELRLARLSDRYHPAGTVSVENGRFTIGGVEAGDYHLTGERSGYIETAYGAKNAENEGAVLRLGAGQSLTGITLRMIPAGVISGTVRDSDGESLEDAHLILARRTYQSGVSAMEEIDSTDSDDLGQYRFRKLSPGKYYVIAEKRDTSGNVEVYSAPPGPRLEPVSTVYPGVADLSMATAIEITRGGRVAGIDIKLLRRPVFRVSGQFIPAGQAPGNLSLSPADANARISDSHMGALVDIRTGNFEFERVPPGSYLLQARGGLTASMPVEVGARDVDGIRLAAGGLGEIHGRIRVEGSGKFVNGSVFVTREGRRNGSMARIRDVGSFATDQLAPGKYQLHIASGQMSGLYVKSTRVEGIDCGMDEVGVLSGGATNVEIVLGGDGGRLNGMVHAEDGSAAASATVVLIPAGRLKGRVDLYRVASSDQFGNFQADNVAPGSYKVLAWSEVEPYAWFDPDFIGSYRKYALDWEIGANGQARLDLKIAATAGR